MIWQAGVATVLNNCSSKNAWRIGDADSLAPAKTCVVVGLHSGGVSRCWRAMPAVAPRFETVVPRSICAAAMSRQRACCWPGVRHLHGPHEERLAVLAGLPSAQHWPVGRLGRTPSYTASSFISNEVDDIGPPWQEVQR